MRNLIDKANSFFAPCKSFVILAILIAAPIALAFFIIYAIVGGT